MKRLLIICAALSLSGCTGLGTLTAPPAPAPLARTTVDDRALETAWKTFDLALDALIALGDAGVIVPGTPRGRAVAAGIRRVNSALASAERFAAAGSSGDYLAALRDANAGIQELRNAVGAQ